MKDKKFLFNLFDKNGNDYEVVVTGKKSASNLFDWIWEELKTIMGAEEREQDIRERKLLRKRKIQQFNAFIRDMEIALEKTEERRA